MKSAFLLLIAAFVAATVVFGQAQSQAPAQGDQGQPQVLGRGRGGAPFAWNDQDKDGVCDLTGRPVGQGRAIGFGGGKGRAGAYARRDRDRDGICDFTGRPVGRGQGAAVWGRGGRGWGRAFAAGQAQVQKPAEQTPAQR